MPGSLESIAELLGIIAIFIIVVVVCYFTTRFIASRQIIQKKSGNFEVIETHSVAQNRFLQLVRMGNKYIVISVSKDSVRFITELSEEEVVLQKKEASIQQKSFKDILSSFSKKEEKNTKTEENSTDK